MIKEHPILFSTNMVNAILAGNKTQTRRIIKPQPDCNGVRYMQHPPLDWEQYYKEKWKPYMYDTEEGESIAINCPYGGVGEYLWVRESFCKNLSEEVVIYKADYPNEKFKWTPSIFMSRKQSRIILKVNNIRVQRIHDITEKDAFAEGIQWLNNGNCEDCFQWTSDKQSWFDYYADCYKYLWNSINGKDSWNSNPWVWVITFKVTKKGMVINYYE